MLINHSFNERVVLLELSVQDFIIDTLKDNYFKGDHGSIFKISKEAIDKYKIYQVSLFEALDKKSMLLAGLTTESDGKLLESSGMVHLEIKTRLNGKINLEDTGCEIMIPKQDTSKQMKLFYGDNDDGTNWKFEVPDPVLRYSLDTIGGIRGTMIPLFSDFYCFPISKGGWINADLFYKYKSTHEFEAIASIDMKTMRYNMVFDNINGILSGSVDPATKKVKFGKIPRGESAKIIGIGIYDGKLFASVDKINSSSPSLQLSPMKEMSKRELKVLLEKNVN